MLKKQHNLGTVLMNIKLLSLLLMTNGLGTNSMASDYGSNEPPYPGTEDFMTCQKVAGDKTDWAKMARSPSLHIESDKWTSYYEHLITEAKFDGKTYTQILDEISTAAGSKESGRRQKVTQLLKSANKGMFDLITGKRTKHFSKKCALYVQTFKLGHVDLAEISEDTLEPVESLDKKIKCSTHGVETQDYGKCRDIVNFYNATFLGKQALQGVQQFQAMDQAMEQQEEMMKSSNEDFTKGLKLQKDGLKTQANMANTRGAVDMAAAGTFVGLINTMPTVESLSQECGERTDLKRAISQINIGASTAIAKKMKELQDAASPLQQNTNPNEYLTVSLNPSKDLVALERSCTGNNEKCFLITLDNAQDTLPIENSQTTVQKHCTDFFRDADHELILNSMRGRDEAIKTAMDLGMSGLVNLGQAALLNKQAGNIDDAIKKVDAFEPVDWTPPESELTATECQADPTKEGCAMVDFQSGTRYTGQGFSVSGIGAGGVVGSGSTSGDDGALNENEQTVDNPNEIADTIATALPSAGGSGGLDNVASAATVKSGGKPGGAGGGGGGAGGAAAPAPSKTAAAKGKDPFIGKSAKVGYGGGKGSLSYGGGSSKRSAKKGVTNPFDKLFNKKKGGPNNGVMNFRDLASSGIGGKKGSLFQRVSSRYSNVSKQKDRLMQYEAVK